jgi:hypothetical protein
VKPHHVDNFANVKAQRTGWCTISYMTAAWPLALYCVLENDGGNLQNLQKMNTMMRRGCLLMRSSGRVTSSTIPRYPHHNHRSVMKIALRTFSAAGAPPSNDKDKEKVRTRLNGPLLIYAISLDV